MLSKIYEVRDSDNETLFFMVVGVPGGRAVKVGRKPDAISTAVQQDNETIRIVLINKDAENNIRAAEEFGNIEREIVVAEILMRDETQESDDLLRIETREKKEYFIGWSSKANQPSTVPSKNKEIIIAQIVGWIALSNRDNVSGL